MSMFGHTTALPVAFEFSWTAAVWTLLTSLALFAVANGVVVFVIVRMPPTYFCTVPVRLSRSDRHWALHWAVVIGKNVAGALAVVIGIVLAMPGVPGPGIVLILIGSMLLDFPGKHRLIRSLVRREKVLRNLNRLRTRFGKPPFTMDRQ